MKIYLNMIFKIIFDILFYYSITYKKMPLYFTCFIKYINNDFFKVDYPIEDVIITYITQLFCMLRSEGHTHVFAQVHQLVLDALQLIINKLIFFPKVEKYGFI